MNAPVSASALAFLILLSGCGTVSQHFDGQVVQIDGKPVLVSKQRNQSNFYRGTQDKAMLSQASLHPADNARNVRAIAAATGCPVDPNSITHNNGVTTAAVSCAPGQSPKF